MRAGRAILAAIAIVALACATEATAADGHQYDRCFATVGHYYHINPLLLRAIARQESHFNPRATNSNGNGSTDVGLMQINSMWFPMLRRAGINPERLVTDPCLNIAVGGLILSNNIKHYGMSWTAVGAYNAATPWKRDRYAAQVAHKLLHELRAVNADTAVAAAEE